MRLSTPAPLAAVRRHAAPIQRFANGAAWFFIVVSLAHLAWVIPTQLAGGGLVTLYQTEVGGEVHRAWGMAYDGLPGLLQALLQAAAVAGAAILTLLPWQRGRRVGHTTLIAWSALWALNLGWLASLDGAIDSYAQATVASLLMGCTIVRAMGGWTRTPKRPVIIAPASIEVDDASSPARRRSPAQWVARGRGAIQRSIARTPWTAVDAGPRLKKAAHGARNGCRRRGAAALATVASRVQRQADKLACTTPTSQPKA